MATPRRPGQRAPRDRTGQRAQSTQATSSTRAGRAPGPRPRLRGPLVLIFFVLGVLLSIAAASAMPIRQEKFHQQLTAPQGLKRSLSEKCLPGFYMEEASGDCMPCTDKVDYTNYSNTLSSCLLCKICKSGEEEKSPCTSTKDTECQCKPGTFRREDAPEFCYKCRTRCPDGMVVATPCSPFSDLTCVDRKSGTQASGEAPVPGETVTTRPRLSTTPSSSSDTSQLVIGIVTAGVLLLLVLIVLPCIFWWFCIQGRGVEPKCLDKVLFRRSHPLRGPGALDNAHNNMLIERDSLIDLVPEQEAEEQVKPTDATAQSQGEAKRLLEPAEAEASHTRRRLLVPANGADPTESLRLFFDDFATIVPCDSWDLLMRKLGLTQNEILLVREGVRVPRDALYEMLDTWVSNKGREASVNTLLDALEKLGQRLAKETIQDHLLDSGKYVYEDGEAGSAVS